MFLSGTIKHREADKMTITKKKENARIILELTGRLDTKTAPSLEREIINSVTGETRELILDFKELQYISSTGLRVLLGAQKRMNSQGSMVIRNANEMVKEVFQVTGFISILTVE